MAWVDDRIYCHPKLMRVGKPARWTFVAGIAYSAGWGTRGMLTTGEQEAIGATSKLRAELVGAGLWEDVGSGTVLIHDWNDHNDKRDARREADRLRKREERMSKRQSAGTSAGQSNGRSTVAARVEGSEGSERKPKAVTEGLSQRPQIASDEVRHLIDASLKEASTA